MGIVLELLTIFLAFGRNLMNLKEFGEKIDSVNLNGYSITWLVRL